MCYLKQQVVKIYSALHSIVGELWQHTAETRECACLSGRWYSSEDGSKIQTFQMTQILGKFV